VPNSGSPHHERARVFGRSSRAAGRPDRVAVLQATMIRSQQKAQAKSRSAIDCAVLAPLCQGTLQLPGRSEADFFVAATSSAALGDTYSSCAASDTIPPAAVSFRPIELNTMIGMAARTGRTTTPTFHRMRAEPYSLVYGGIWNRVRALASAAARCAGRGGAPGISPVGQGAYLPFSFLHGIGRAILVLDRWLRQRPHSG
jgi:hypothetical protein